MLSADGLAHPRDGIGGWATPCAMRRDHQAIAYQKSGLSTSARGIENPDATVLLQKYVDRCWGQKKTSCRVASWRGRKCSDCSLSAAISYIGFEIFSRCRLDLQVEDDQTSKSCIR